MGLMRKSPTASRKEVPRLPVRYPCRLIRDEAGASPDSARWVTQRTDSKDTRHQSGQLYSDSHLLSEVFHAGDRDNQGSPGHGDTVGRPTK
jgi:hypothetical protein